MCYYKIIDVCFCLDFEGERYRVMLLLFIILVENVFKYGVENLWENVFIDIDFLMKGDMIYFFVENNFDDLEFFGGVGIGF